MPSRPRTAEFSDQVEQFAAKVRQARMARGWSQLKLSEESGISYRQIQLIEGNSNNDARAKSSPQPANPKLDTVYLLAAALEIDVAYLVDPSRAVSAQP